MYFFSLKLCFIDIPQQKSEGIHAVEVKCCYFCCYFGEFHIHKVLQSMNSHIIDF